MLLPAARRDLPSHLTALANPTRLRILEQLADGDRSVNDLALHMRMSQPRISWHLRMLRLGGAIRTRREGRLVYCSLDRETIRHRLSELAELLRLEEATPPVVARRAAIAGKG